jgi:hypothetical protein
MGRPLLVIVHANVRSFAVLHRVERCSLALIQMMTCCRVHFRAAVPRCVIPLWESSPGILLMQVI